MLISQMLQVNVDSRFTAEEVLSHPWVTVSARKRPVQSSSLVGSDCAHVEPQDEPPADSNTVSNPDEEAAGDTVEPEQESPKLETKHVPSPLV